jgi:hypothetical protein
VIPDRVDSETGRGVLTMQACEGYLEPEKLRSQKNLNSGITAPGALRGVISSGLSLGFAILMRFGRYVL